MGKTLQTIEKQAGNRAGTLASAATVKYGYARPVKQDFTRLYFAGPGLAGDVVFYRLFEGLGAIPDERSSPADWVQEGPDRDEIRRHLGRQY
jgi:hypothetical protein